MFCPGCGKEELQAVQYCRACGTDLRNVRVALETPDQITASAMSARDEIGRAVAAKIRETESAYELKKVAEDVLPEIEKFLESPAEKRLRRMRVGTLLSSIGLGAAIALSLAGIFVGDQDFFFLAALGSITFFIGLGFIINGIFLTNPKNALFGRSSTTTSSSQSNTLAGNTNDLRLTEPPSSAFTSVTEHTTHHLHEKQPVPRD